MRTLQKFVSVLAGIIAAAAIITPVRAQESIAVASRFAEVNGTKLHYLIAGKGDPVSCCMATRRPATCGCR